MHTSQAEWGKGNGLAKYSALRNRLNDSSNFAGRGGSTATIVQDLGEHRRGHRVVPQNVAIGGEVEGRSPGAGQFAVSPLVIGVEQVGTAQNRIAGYLSAARTRSPPPAASVAWSSSASPKPVARHASIRFSAIRSTRHDRIRTLPTSRSSAPSLSVADPPSRGFVC